jgi:hypothetical protein
VGHRLFFRVRCRPAARRLRPPTNFMLTGTSTFMTSTPYRSFVNSSMLFVTISGFFFA